MKVRHLKRRRPTISAAQRFAYWFVDCWLDLEKARRMQRQAATYAEYQKLHQESQAKEQQRRLELREVETEKLKVAVPEWRDEAAFHHGLAEIRTWAVARGYSSEDLNKVVLARDVLVFRDAMRGGSP